MKKTVQTLLLVIMFLFITANNLSYAGIHTIHESIEIKLKNYNNTKIIIKDKYGNEIKLDENGKKILPSVYTKDENFIQVKKNKIIIENLYNDVDVISLEKITIEITNNLGNTDTIHFDFGNGYNEQCFYYHYNCDDGVIHDFSTRKYYMQEIESHIHIIITIITMILIACFCLYKTIFGLIKK